VLLYAASPGFAGMVQLLNDNSGFVMAVLTGVYVVATWVIAAGARRANELAASGLRQAMLLEQQRNRPHVTFDFEEADRTVYAVVRNVGIAPAFNVSVELKPELDRTLDGRPAPLAILTENLRVLPQGREFVETASYGDFYREHRDTTFDAIVSYADSDQREYTARFSLPVSQTRGLVHHSSRSVPGELRRIRKEIERIGRS